MQPQRSTPGEDSAPLCRHCQRELRVRRPNQLYCDKQCRNDFYGHTTSRYADAVEPVSTMTSGAIHELRVAVDLMSRGYAVFRALSPHSPCDLIAYLPGRVPLRVEVRSAHRSPYTGVVQRPARMGEDHRFDVLAMVLLNDIVYDPSLESQE